MTQLAKAILSTEGNTLRMGMDISKVDKKGRMVYGWATLDNEDYDGDIITAEASADAFARSRMNLREMHQKDSAVGRIVSFKEDTFRAPDGEVHKGIFVKVYVSKGAEDTWQKVLDKTLNGFSIGGEVTKAEERLNKATGKTGKKILGYNLNELSLVDNPNNPYSDFTNVFKIRKSADGAVTSVTGLIEKGNVLNVFYCKEHKTTFEKPDESYECPVCETKMENIGFVENGGELAKSVTALLTKYRGGEDMSLDNLTLLKAAPAEEVKEVQEVEPVTEPVVDGLETGVVEEVADVESEVVKQIDSLKENVEQILSKATLETKQEIAELKKSIDDATQDFRDKTSEFEKKLNEFDENLKLTKSRITDAETRLEKGLSRSALKKSVDSSEDDATVDEQNSSWEGSALDVRSAFSVSQYL
jgi:ElaB/YqjD/DUF883 family membrane-anchored ribosome-binding protein